MAKTRTRMSYRKAKAGSTRGISASQWNGLVDMHKNFYNTPAGQRPLPSVLQNSTVAMAVMDEDHEGETIGAFQPVRIVKSINFLNVRDQTAGFVIQPVDSTFYSDNRHGNYGFTLSEGIQSGGGRIVIAGNAIVQVAAEDAVSNKGDVNFDGTYDSSYYSVPDFTLSDYQHPIAPMGHFKIVSGYVPADIDKAVTEPTQPVYIVIDMSQRPTTFSARIKSPIPAAIGTSPDIEWATGYASPLYCADGTGGLSNPQQTLTMEEDEQVYEINVYNTTSEIVQTGEHLVTYSREYNRFLIVSGSGGGGGGAGYMVRTGSSGLVAGVAQDLDVYEASNEASDPTITGDTKRVVHNWSTDMGSFIPSNVNMIVVECSDGFSRPINIDNSWMSHTTLLQKWMGSSFDQVIDSSMLNGQWSTVDMGKSRFYGYGLSSLGTPSVVDVLRTGVYNVSVQWTTFTHVLDASIRIIDHSGVLQTQLFNSGTSANGGFMIQTGYTVTQSMLNSGGVTLGIEASYSGSSTSNATEWGDFTFNVERVGD